MEKAVELASELCRYWEGFSKTPYICPAGYWTIGYGSTTDNYRRPVSKNTPSVTKEEADALLLRDLRSFLVQVLLLCPALATQHSGRVAAILDFTYNLGPGRLKISTLRKKINSDDWEAVPTELRKWILGGGKVLPGLVKRREDEIRLFTN